MVGFVGGGIVHQLQRCLRRRYRIVNDEENFVAEILDHPATVLDHTIEHSRFETIKKPCEFGEVQLRDNRV